MDKTDMDAVFMRRCLQLASLGRGYVSPNPMVGAVVVHRGRIIGEDIIGVTVNRMPR